MTLAMIASVALGVTWSRAGFAWMLLWAVLTVYALLMSIDVGAGVYLWVGRWLRKGDAAKRVADTYLTPVWEVTNVFLILFVMGTVGFFPQGAQALGTALLIPVSLAGIALALRGTAIAISHVSHGDESRDWRRYLPGVSAFAGVATLPALAIYLTAGESGAITFARGVEAVSWGRLFLAPSQLTLGALAIALALYLSATFLAGFALRRGERDALAFYRRAGLRTGLVSTSLGVMFALALAVTSPDQARTLLSLWPAHLLAIALNGAVLWSLWRGREAAVSAARWVLLGAVALALLMFGWSRLPYIVRPWLTTTQALTVPATFDALLATVFVGALFLLPSLWLLYRLFFQTGAPASPIGDVKVADVEDVTQDASPSGSAQNYTHKASGAGTRRPRRMRLQRAPTRVGGK